MVGGRGQEQRVVDAGRVLFGAYKGRRVEANLAAVTDLAFEVLSFDSGDARCAGQIRALPAMSGRSGGPYDVLIAGQALARDLTLITHNPREFSRVAELRVEDWES